MQAFANSQPRRRKHEARGGHGIICKLDAFNRNSTAAAAAVGPPYQVDRKVHTSKTKLGYFLTIILYPKNKLLVYFKLD